MSHDIRSIEKLSLIGYERLSTDFYRNELHPTTHAFGLAIEEYLRKEWQARDSELPCLEVGAGRSRLFRFLDRIRSEFIVSDISSSMLSHSRCLARGRHITFAVASAFALPFRNMSLSSIFSILGDAYGTRIFFEEAFRVLAKGGTFLYSAPSAIWGHALRRHWGMDVNVTPMVDSEGRTVLVPSILMLPTDLQVELESVGFSRVEVRELFLPKEIRPKEVPPHISIAAEVLGVDAYSLPIVTVVNAVRESEGG